MKTQTVDATRNTRKPRILAFFCLFALLLTACSSSAPPSQAPEPTPESAVQPQAGGHPPVILRVVEREQVIDGYSWHYQDVYFTDPDGDATAMTYVVTSSSLTYPLDLADEPIEASAAEQKVEALFTVPAECWQKVELAFESRIRDQAGNLSEPVLFTMSCTTPPAVDTRSFLVSGLGTFLPIALILLLGFWLLFRKRPAERLRALRSMILMFFLFMILRFFHLIVHEGGHSLYPLVRGIPSTLYVHPFILEGLSRPIILNHSILYDILGSATALPIGLLISLLFWQRRSPALLPWVMLFPYTALVDGFNVMGIIGDFWNVVQATGWPAAPFLILGVLIICIGIISLLSLLPLAGLDPRDNKALAVFPAAMFLISALSIPVAYFMGRDIVLSTTSFGILWFVIGIVLAVLYVTLFRRLYPRLPAWLRTETVNLTWKDLRLPGILWAVSVIIGLIIAI
jgi:hypothetical protein